MSIKVPYNKGDAYEDKVFRILQQLNFTIPNSRRAGAGGGTDMVLIHKGKRYNLEVKKDLGADYGQKMLKWSDDNWHWAVDDETTKLYTDLGALAHLNRRRIVPIKFNKDDKDLTYGDKKTDMQRFEDRIEIPLKALFEFYTGKNCFYMQVGAGFGFYHLAEDVADLGTQQFDAVFRLRFRAKTIHSKPVWKYGFYAVLKVESKPTRSKFNLEKLPHQSLPPIEP